MEAHIQGQWLILPLPCEVKLHFTARLVDIVVLVVVVLLILLDDGLELRVSVRTVRSLLVVSIQHIIGHVFPLHLLSVLFYVRHHEGVPVSIAAAMAITFDHDSV